MRAGGDGSWLVMATRLKARGETRSMVDLDVT